MKITMVFGAFLPVPPIRGGAVEKVGFALAREFARRGHEVSIVSRALASLPNSEHREGIQFLRVSGFDAPRSLLWLKFLDLIYSIRVRRVLPPAHIIMTHTFWLPILLRSNHRGIVYMHVGRQPKGQMRLYRHVGRLQAPTHALADAIKKEVQELGPKIAVIPNPAPEPVRASPPPPLAEREKIILFVGRVHPEKGIHLLIDAVAGKPAAFPDWKLVIVGPTEIELGGGGKDYFVDLKRRAGDAAVVFRGAIFDAAALENEFRSAQIFVYPSVAERGETFGLAALEAMAQGCAVFVSDLTCFRDFARDGQTGFVFNHRALDPVQALREKIASAIVDPALLAHMAEAGYHQATVEYSLSRVADRFIDDFESLLQNSNGRGTSR